MSRFSSERPSDQEAIAATAAAWLAQRDEGFTPREAAEFARWRAADPRHDLEIARLEATWSALQQLRDFRPEAARHPDRDLLAARGRRIRVIPALAATVAFAAAVALVAAWWASSHRPGAEAASVAHSTTMDGFERVLLPDGSMAELNAATEIRVLFSPEERRVRLVRGEAHFTVAKNPARPFRVRAGDVDVQAVGTAFNVRLQERSIEILVTEGKVAVAEGARPAATASSTDARVQTKSVSSPSEATEVSANERLVLASPTGSSPGRSAVEKLAPAAVREALAWQGPRLVFTDTPLAEAIAQFNRRNPAQLELGDAELADWPIDGSFRAENVDAFVRLLASGGEVEVDRIGPLRIVLRKAGPRANLRR